jgi:cyclic pyranopterin phosphate synthase
MMVDITNKDIVYREAKAYGKIKLRKETIDAIKKGEIKKGDVFTITRIASILAVKNTPMSIPLCHNIPINHIDLDFKIGEDYIEVYLNVKANAKTGVEMEALHGVAIALLNIWDMVKYLEKDEKGAYPYTKIEEIKVLEKIKK